MLGAGLPSILARGPAALPHSGSGRSTAGCYGARGRRSTGD